MWPMLSEHQEVDGSLHFWIVVSDDSMRGVVVCGTELGKRRHDNIWLDCIGHVSQGERWWFVLIFLVGLRSFLRGDGREGGKETYLTHLGHCHC